MLVMRAVVTRRAGGVFSCDVKSNDGRKIVKQKQQGLRDWQCRSQGIHD